MLMSGVMPMPPPKSTSGRSSPPGYVKAPAGARTLSTLPGRASAWSAFDTRPCLRTEISRYPRAAGAELSE